MPPPLMFQLARGRNRAKVAAPLGWPPFEAAMPVPSPTYLRIYGVTKDSTGAVLGSCNVQLFETLTDRYVGDTTSNASGEYEFREASLSTNYYVVAYKIGAPDLAGTTVNTLIGS